MCSLALKSKPGQNREIRFSHDLAHIHVVMFIFFRPNRKDEHDQPTDRKTGIFMYDKGCQTRGTGRTYDSKSGVCMMIGNMTGKICAYSVRIKGCRKHKFYSNKGLTPPPHTCHKNREASS